MVMREFNTPDFNTDYPLTAVAADSDLGPNPGSWVIPSNNEGEMKVEQLEDGGPEQDAMDRKHDGDLITGVPSIKVVIGGKEHYLTWAEAYNLGYALQRTADVSLYG